MPEDTFIVCDSLVKIYKVAQLEVFALQGLDLAVNRGELLGIVGASGSGKSTLLNILGGLDRPSAGKVWVDGKNLLALSDIELTRYRRKKVGFIWQQGARNLLPYLTALENVEVPMTLEGMTLREARKRAEMLLEIVGLDKRKNHTMQQLSGGEQQRVAISVALANQPSLLLADEPTGELDTATSLTVYQAFNDLNHQLGVTTLIVSHDATIAHHVQRVVAIRDGKTSSETVRVEAGRKESGDGQGTDQEAASEEMGETEFEELIVLDSAGRLQVPKEFLERFSIKDRARLEVTLDGILIKPAQSTSQNNAPYQPPSQTQGKRRHGLKIFSKKLDQEDD
jgi:ABC-type lipoprotein export system ATPase subunit/bifunctional DNA-binding transcriptional regulator/antitoxin component of YhaV-PrlF toxin-antitoxin module